MNRMRNIALRFGGLVIFCLIVISCQNMAAQSQEKPYSYDEIKTFLEENVKSPKIIPLIYKKGVNFILTSEQTYELTLLHASIELIRTINQKYIDPSLELVITNPKNGDKVGPTALVEGTSSRMKGKHLWVFLHRADLRYEWWPQVGEVEIDEATNEWRQSVYVGQIVDVGFNFEIKAIWLNNDDHERMENYMERARRDGLWPGISLPKGDPHDTVTVKKIRH